MDTPTLVFCTLILILVAGIASGLVFVAIYFHNRINKTCNASGVIAEELARESEAIRNSQAQSDAQFANAVMDIDNTFKGYYVYDPSKIVSINPESGNVTLNSVRGGPSSLHLQNTDITADGASLRLTGPNAQTALVLDDQGVNLYNGNLRIGGYELSVVPGDGLYVCKSGAPSSCQVLLA